MIPTDPYWEYPKDRGKLHGKQARRVDILAEILGLDRQRIIGWGVAQAVLSAWWGFEDSGEIWMESLRCAEVLAELL